MARLIKAKEGEIRFKLPTPEPLTPNPDPQIVEMRERLARVEERSLHQLDHNPVAQEALQMATAARESAARAEAAAAAALERAAAAPAQAVSQVQAHKPEPPTLEAVVDGAQPVDLGLKPEEPKRKSFWDWIN